MQGVISQVENGSRSSFIIYAAAIPGATDPDWSAAMMKQYTVPTSSRTQFVDITDMVRRAVQDLKIVNGVITVFVPHTTSGITINENADPDVVADMIAALDRMVPWAAGYRHAEGNAAAHVKASMMGSSARIIVAEGMLQLGCWQAIYFCEFDGPRTRTMWVSA
jgi:secondary thiamine-phosphate synthase enzyme